MHSPSAPVPTPAPHPPGQPPAPRRTPSPGVATALGAGLLGLAVLLTALVTAEWGPLLSLDRAVAGWLHGQAVAEPGLTRVNRLLSDWLWDPWTMRALTALAVVVLWLRGERPPALWVAATSVLGSLAQQAMKWAVDRDRPHWPDPVDSAHFAAFPSGHAMTATVTCGLLLWLTYRHGASPWVRRTAVVVAVVSVAGVGFTRLWLGVHWVSDVVGGWLLGGALVWLSVATYGRLAVSRRGW
ncbi:phosphatase PAP2 family protein [Streptomyces sp. NPDC012623]|uniref:phosphatase PAP2 family protein n=1 Tax=unclassified Streptomyces TaxID=2593676 RepID=UPI003685543F